MLNLKCIYEYYADTKYVLALMPFCAAISFWKVSWRGHDVETSRETRECEVLLSYTSGPVVQKPVSLTLSLGPVHEFVCISFRTCNLNCFRVK